MYKCKECGAEYEEKPDYCDCGNDEFELVAANIEKIPETPVEKKSIDETNFHETIKNPQPASSMNFHNKTQSSVYTKRVSSINTSSLAIFLLCIFLSLYVIFFAWNPKEQDIKPEIKQETEISKSIPSIDKFWNNAVPVVKTEEPKQEEKIENIIKQIIPVKTQPKNETTQKTQKIQQNVTKVQLKKTAQPSKNTSQTVANKTVKTQSNTTAQEQARLAAEAAEKQKAEQERKAAEAAQIKKLQAEQAKKAAEEKARQAQVDKQELLVYKANLRNTIGRKIDFTKVIGDGSCTVAFKIDSNGRLTNRSFAKQSPNNTLNDAVYNAVMSTPTFNPPPAAYNNETLNLNISFYNGNFEISLP